LLLTNNVNFTEIFYLPYEREFKSEKNSKTCSFGSLIGTIEFFDFYIYANAAVLVFPNCFSSFGQYQLFYSPWFSIAFLSRPLGSAVFGHYGDKVGRKTTLVIALLTMGISTVSIGFFTYASIGIAVLINAMSLWPRCWFRR
jgi:MFS family permease